jgi:hypothetical protein
LKFPLYHLVLHQEVLALVIEGSGGVRRVSRPVNERRSQSLSAEQGRYRSRFSPAARDGANNSGPKSDRQKGDLRVHVFKQFKAIVNNNLDNTARAQSLRAVLETFKKDYLPDAVPVEVNNSAIATYGACHDVVSAESLYGEMIEKTDSSYVAMMKVYIDDWNDKGSRLSSVDQLIKAKGVHREFRNSTISVAPNMTTISGKLDRLINRVAHHIRDNAKLPLANSRTSGEVKNILADLLPRYEGLIPIDICNKAITTMGSKGELGSARELFDSIPEEDKTEVTYRAMLNLYNVQNESQEVLSLYDITPDRLKGDKVIKSIRGKHARNQQPLSVDTAMGDCEGAPSQNPAGYIPGIYSSSDQSGLSSAYVQGGRIPRRSDGYRNNLPTNNEAGSSSSVQAAAVAEINEHELVDAFVPAPQLWTDLPVNKQSRGIVAERRDPVPRLLTEINNIDGLSIQLRELVESNMPVEPTRDFFVNTLFRYRAPQRMQILNRFASSTKNEELSPIPVEDRVVGGPIFQFSAINDNKRYTFIHLFIFCMGQQETERNRDQLGVILGELIQKMVPKAMNDIDEDLDGPLQSFASLLLEKPMSHLAVLQLLKTFYEWKKGENEGRKLFSKPETIIEIWARRDEGEDEDPNYLAACAETKISRAALIRDVFRHSPHKVRKSLLIKSGFAKKEDIRTLPEQEVVDELLLIHTYVMNEDRAQRFAGNPV